MPVSRILPRQHIPFLDELAHYDSSRHYGSDYGSFTCGYRGDTATIMKATKTKHKKGGHQGTANSHDARYISVPYPRSFIICFLSTFGNILRKWSSNRSFDSSGFLLYTLSAKDLP